MNASDNETVEQICEKMKEPSIYNGRFPASFFDGEFCVFADRILAAHTREIAAKDTEIASLRALVKELAGLASNGLCYLDCSGCPLEEDCSSKRRRDIIAKALEVVK